MMAKNDNKKPTGWITIHRVLVLIMLCTCHSNAFLQAAGNLGDLNKLMYERFVSSKSQEDFLKRLDAYEVTYPETVESQRHSQRQRRDASDPEESVYKISAFGKSYALVLHTNYDLIGDGVLVEYHNGDEFHQEKISSTNCYKIGDVLGGTHSIAALSDCDGLAGAFQTDDGMVFIEPYDNVTNVSPDTRQGYRGRPHFIYKQRSTRRDKEWTESDTFKEDVPPRMSAAEKEQLPVAVVAIGEIVTRGSSASRGKRTRRDSYDSFIAFINKAKRSVQLYWLDIFGHPNYFITVRPNEQKGINTFEDTKWIAMDEDTNIRMLVNNGTEFVARANEETLRSQIVITVPPNTKFPDKKEVTVVAQGDNKYIETMVIADDSVVGYHGKDKVERFVLTLMNLASRIFKDPSLGAKINFIVTRLVLMQKANKQLRIIDKNPSRSVISACNYAFSLQEGSDSDKNHFDFALVLTRRPFGPSGYAPVYDMCTKSRSCALVDDDGFTSAFIAAHETGHTLGLEHDGEGNTCKSDGPKGSVMSPVVVSRFDRYYWSPCSQKSLRQNIGYFKCLNDMPSQTMKYMKSLPGSYYTLNEQCEFMMGRGAEICTAFKSDPCRMLWCTSPGKKLYCKTHRSPALDGSTCANGKWCLKGQCVSNKYIPETTLAPVTTPALVDGKWSKWGRPSSCTVSCGIGVQYRSRSCTRPRPSNGGRSCEGVATEKSVCNTQKCSLTVSYADARTNQCVKLAGRDWQSYNDSDFDLVLQQQRNNYNCTFDESTCNWRNVAGGDIFDWRRKSGATPSRGTGPDQDHTFGNSRGSYMYIESSDDYQQRRRPGDKAWLVGPAITVPRTCFRMYYHMHGETTGALRVLMAPASGSGENAVLWQKRGKQGNKWIQAVIQIDSARPHKIIIEAERGRHYTSDIAIDDVSLATGPCDTASESNPCLMSCRTRSRGQFKMDLVVEDGTRCYDNRTADLCIKGQCVKFGCDLRFGSSKLIDLCGICGGDGTSCERIASSKHFTPTREYELIIRLPQGSTNIVFEDRLPTSYKLGLRQEGSGGLFYGDPRRSTFSYREIAGTTFHFTKNNDGKQLITATGPTSANLEVMLHSNAARSSKAFVTYNFYQSKSARKMAVQKVRYVITGWTPCSASCGVGRQTTVIQCLIDHEDKVVNGSRCVGVTPPKKRVRSCNLSPCASKYRWYALSWRRCSVSCGEGRQVRIVACVNSAVMRVVSGRLCTDAAPANVQSCSQPQCPLYKWQANPWQACPVSCGGDLQYRKVQCQDITRNKTVAESLCSDSKPITTQPCALMPCDSFAYTSTFGECSKSCGSGIRVRLVRCMNAGTGGMVEKKFCSGPAPPPIDVCNVFPCPEYVWKLTEYGRCSQTCGQGEQRREVKCTNKATSDVVDDANCVDDRPAATKTCIETNCPIFDWRVGQWTQCSALCGEGSQSRGVACVARASNTITSDKDCKDQKPNRQQRCLLKNCTQDKNMDCEFEKQTFCNWKNDPRAVFEWSIGTETPSRGTGPSGGHKSDKFAYMEGSSPRRYGDKAALLSPPLSNAQGCFRLWYHMHGSSVGHLTVYYVGLKNRKVLFHLDGGQGNAWKYKEMDINKEDTDNEYQLLLMAERGQTFSSDIAIDDLSFTSSKCTPTTSTNALKKKEAVTCREISPLCLISHKKEYCKYRSYRSLCCETCAGT